jgi:hypothetical protein
MKRPYLLLLVFLYVFMVLLRVLGQLMNGTPIDWKSTLTLGELDNTQDYGDRWRARIALLLALPFIWLHGMRKFFERLI